MAMERKKGYHTNVLELKHLKFPGNTFSNIINQNKYFQLEYSSCLSQYQIILLTIGESLIQYGIK